jgi:hypothetical protein
MYIYTYTHNIYKVHTGAGMAACGWHALLAGLVGGWLIWAHHSSVNEQIAMYTLLNNLFKRVHIYCIKNLFKKENIYCI